MIVYGIAWVIFDVKKSTDDGGGGELSESDSGKFRVSCHKSKLMIQNRGIP